MKNLIVYLLAIVLTIVPTVLTGQTSMSLGLGAHSEGGGVRPGGQAILSLTHPTSLSWLHLRGEAYVSLSQGRRPGFSAPELTSNKRSILGFGAGVQAERINVKNGKVRPYLYVVPTASYLTENRWGSGIDLGLAGGIGGVKEIADRDWFAELSWRGHGDRQVDETALGALSIGVRF